jgi:hypothetical protein
MWLITLSISMYVFLVSMGNLPLIPVVTVRGSLSGSDLFQRFSNKQKKPTSFLLYFGARGGKK